jgi:hypothetical protein
LKKNIAGTDRNPAVWQVGQRGDGRIPLHDFPQGDDHCLAGVDGMTGMELPGAIVIVVRDSKDGHATLHDGRRREDRHVW